MRLQYRDTPVDPAVTERNRQAVLDAFDSIVAGDFAALWGLLAEDVVFYEASSLPYGGEFHGIAAAKAAFTELSGYYAEMDTVVDAIVAGEDIVMVYETVKYRALNGNRGTNIVSELFRFRDGKVTEWRAFYFDSAMIAQSLSAGAAGGQA